jgi:uncharacterized protein
MRKNTLFLSVAAQWNVAKAQLIDEWIESILTIHGIEDKAYRNFTLELLNDPKYTSLINNFIQKADLGINAIHIVDIPLDRILSKNETDNVKDSFGKDNNSRFDKAVFAIHDVYNDNFEIAGQYPMYLNVAESEGTKKYFNIIGLLITALLENRVIIIDEFDARLHKLLTKAILKLFNSSTINSTAQLIVASHDTALLDREILRRDKIYFMEKDLYGASTALSLVEYKARKESPYDKNFLDGKYGGIPFIEDLEKLIVDGKS